MYFSKSLNGFIPDIFKVDGTYSEGTWPKDAVLVSEEEECTYFKVTPPTGKRLGNINGRPAWEEVPQKAVNYGEEARKHRDSFISSTDIMLIADYSIEDNELSAEQVKDLLEIRKSYKSWPKQDNWPMIGMPEVSEWLLEHLINSGYKQPVWPPILPR